MKEKTNELYQISPDTCMLTNCYVIKTVTDKLIVIDGGGVPTREETSGYLYDVLKQISGKETPEVEAWFLTHMHDDHVVEFYKIIEEEKPIKVNNVYFNFPPFSFFETAEGGRYTKHYKSVEKAYDTLFGDGAFSYCNGETAHVGDVYDVDGIKIEILLTYSKEAIPTLINETSLIFSVCVEGQKILFLGDAYLDQGEELLAKYGDGLKSDIVQMSHHGQNGVSKEVYKVISPVFCLWPSPDWVFDNWNGNLNTFETRKWMIEQGVKYHFITGRYKTQKVSLPVDFSSLEKEEIEVK